VVRNAAFGILVVVLLVTCAAWALLADPAAAARFLGNAAKATKVVLEIAKLLMPLLGMF